MLLPTDTEATPVTAVACVQYTTIAVAMKLPPGGVLSKAINPVAVRSRDVAEPIDHGKFNAFACVILT